MSFLLWIEMSFPKSKTCKNLVLITWCQLNQAAFWSSLISPLPIELTFYMSRFQAEMNIVTYDVISEECSSASWYFEGIVWPTCPRVWFLETLINSFKADLLVGIIFQHIMLHVLDDLCDKVLVRYPPCSNICIWLLSTSLFLVWVILYELQKYIDSVLYLTPIIQYWGSIFCLFILLPVLLLSTVTISMRYPGIFS